MSKIQRKSGVIALASIFILATALAGCSSDPKSNQGNNEATHPSNGSTTTTDAGDGRELIGNMYTTGLPIVKDKITLKVAVHRPSYNVPYGEQQILKDLEEKTNIKIEWVEYPTDSIKEQVGVMLASGDYPDIAWRIDMTDKQISDLGESGAIYELNDLVEQYAPTWKALFEQEPSIKKIASTQGGKLYSLPYVYTGEAAKGIRDAWVINKEWLDNLKLEMPTTTEELRTVLKAFKEQDPNGNGIADEIPWTFMFNRYSNGHFDMFGSFGILDFVNHIGVEDNKVFYTATDERFKETIKFLHTLYQDGVIDPEVFTQNVSQFRAKAAAGVVGSAPVFQGDVEFGAEAMLDGKYIAMNPVTSPGVSKPLWRSQTNSVSRGYYTIFKNNKYPEISMRLADELAKADFSISAHYGVKGTHWNEEADGSITIPPSAAETVASEMIQNFGPFVMTKDIMARVNVSGLEAIRRDFYEQYKPYVVPAEQLYPSLMMNANQLDQLTRYETDLNEYVLNQQAKWIVEGGIDEGWDAYVKKVSELNVDQVLAVYQEAYEAYLK